MNYDACGHYLPWRSSPCTCLLWRGHHGPHACDCGCEWMDWNGVASAEDPGKSLQVFTMPGRERTHTVESILARRLGQAVDV